MLVAILVASARLPYYGGPESLGELIGKDALKEV